MREVIMEAEASGQWSAAASHPRNIPVRNKSMSKNYEEAFPGKIAVGADGLGTISPDLVAERALELAKADGRLESNEADLVAAEAELLPNGEFIPPAPEVDDPALENLTAWDEPLDARGGSAEAMAPLDEANIAE